MDGKKQNESYTNAYCLFCSAGYEQKVAGIINRRNKDILAMPVLQEKHKSTNGVRSVVRQVMLPGYVFIYAKEMLHLKSLLCHSKALRLLKDTEGDCELYGENLKYAQWVLSYDGLIGRSKAVRLGGRVKIVEGPLKECEGCITKISKKNRNGRIEMMFMGHAIDIWLPFEWMEEEE
jgi:transcriptional antiterminator NusG